MESKYTKGPWHINILSKRNSMGVPQVTVFKYPIDEKSTVKDIVCNVFGKSIAEADANAKIIASAPELLEALKVLLYQMNNETAFRTWTEADQDAVDLAKAAILKATSI